MKKIFFLLLCACATFSVGAQPLRPPAYPLITHDPYFSLWSFTDGINTSSTKHWTGQDQAMLGFLRVDGQTYQFLGTGPTQVEVVLPTAATEAYDVPYTYEQPSAGWEQPKFKTKGWQTGPAPFGDGAGSNTMKPRSQYDQEIWYRREFTLQDTDFENLQLYISHDDQVEVFLNGVKAFENPDFVLNYAQRPLTEAAKKTLKKGKNLLAVHCTNARGGAYIDAGLIDEHQLAQVTAATQQSVRVSATQTVYQLSAGKADVTVTFTSPLLLDQLEVAARPASYVTFDVQANDGAAHAVQLLFGFSGTLSTNQPYQEVAFQQENHNGLLVQSVGTTSQNVLETKGDDVRIDWGYAYLAAPQKKHVTATTHSLTDMMVFANGKAMPAPKTAAVPATESFVGVTMDLGQVRQKTTEHVLMAYDDLYSVHYFGKNLRPWWRRDGKATATSMIAAAENDYARLMKECTAFDRQLYQEAQAAGGKEYADLCALAYRQAVAAHKIVANTDGSLFFFSKENFSNGSIGTVDVTYPSAPLFIRYNPELMKGMLRFIFDYSETGRWTKPFAAHDVGTYPQATGQTYGEDMPVEETGNMLILTAAIAAKEKDAAFAEEHWETLTTWAGFLEKEGFDPANQLSTDDFAGHLARNANLSIKAIMGLASYGKLAGMLGKADVETKYTTLAKQMAQKWVQMAKDKDHYVLAFGSPGTWSQKYNLVWDKLMGLDIFPPEVHQTELAYYQTKQEPYGLPLDSRKTYTKSDWILWTATLADSPEEFKALVHPVWKFANETPDRIPLSDWHETTNARSVGFRARSVVGGYFIKLLEKRL
ncbi:protein of unknown function [Catalinimonas alkaloidigena]|uniref:L-glutaminase n=1 Tax=Catalinimonas alkaloidigena TaxID=1075417 RepID=A0A1G9A531_9BACT|nr:glutaminase family protein [Catalinimonas alkaloidigena]SDK22509.1 protein of unknown function [Catalinimonas alkaloidigena]